MKEEPRIAVGVMDGRTGISGCLDGLFHTDGLGPISGPFSARGDAGRIVLVNPSSGEIGRSCSLRLAALKDSTFRLFDVTVGKQFHWQKEESQTFRGDLILLFRTDGTLTAINEIQVEEYLVSVVSSEMNGAAPKEFLKSHAILARSWLLAARSRRQSSQAPDPIPRETEPGEIIRWYDREQHELYDVCADDHCQRYQGIGKAAYSGAQDAVRETRGMVMTHGDEICDARYSKACGGITEEFDSAWSDRRVPYLLTTSDAAVAHPAIRSEEEARRWILSNPEAYCCTSDLSLLEKILPHQDLGTTNFFRWRVEYRTTEIEEILHEKSGIDFGRLIRMTPLRRGPSGRISHLKIVGSRTTRVVGKELEIRRWLAKAHLYSSAFVVTIDPDRVVLHGAGWGHGVGLCQIGAAVMAEKGFSCEEILSHYFREVEIKKIY
jgi:stage II sporulation protein D